MARLEGQIAIATLLRRFPEIYLVKQPLRWHTNFTLRGLKALLVVVRETGRTRPGPGSGQPAVS